jgi:hypothetical protein
MLAFGIGLGLAAPTPLGRMDSQDFTSDYSQLQVLQTAAPDMHQVAAPAPASDIADDTEHSKDATSDLLKAAKKAEHEGRKASKDAEKAEAREQLKAQKEREHALQKAQSDEEKRNAEARKEEAHAIAEEAQPLVRSSSDDAKSGVNTAQEKRKAVKEEERAKLKAQKEKERAAQKEANKLERERLNADAREAQKRLADSQRQVGVDAPADKAAPTEERGQEREVTNGVVDERDAMKAAARVQRDAEKAAAKAQNDEQKANAKAQNAAERARAKEQTEQLKVDNEKQRFREAAGRYEAAIKTTERVAEQKSLSKGPQIPVQTYDETGRCPVVGSCGGGDLGVMPDTENDADALPDDGDAGSLCVGSDCNGGGGGGKKGKKEQA